MNTVQRRIATETLTAEVDGVNTVIAQEGQLVPLAYDHLVPDDKTEPANVAASRSSSGRRAAAEARAQEDETPAPKRRRRKSAETDEDQTPETPAEDEA